MSVSLPTIPLTTPSETYATRYGTVFVYHAIFATLAWALLAPVSHFIARIKPTTSFSVHRTAMISAALLTLTTYLLGHFNASATPTQHTLLTNAVMLAVILQSTAGALRPQIGDSPWRTAWATAHRAFGVAVLLFSFFVVWHSLSVFDVDGWLYIVIVVMLFAGACAVCVTVLTGLFNWYAKESQNDGVDDVHGGVERNLLTHPEDSDV